MERRYLVLLASKGTEKRLRALQKEHFRASGDGSPYTMPPLAILGESERTTFDRRHYRVEVSFNSVVESDFGYLLSAGDAFSSIQEELGLPVRPAGLFFSNERPYIEGNIDIVEKSWRLAMLVVKDDYTSALLQ